MSSEQGESSMDREKNELRLARAYSDLLGSEPDEQLLRIVADLDLLHNTGAPSEALYAAKPWLEDPSPRIAPTPPNSIPRVHPLPTRRQNGTSQDRPATQPGAPRRQERPASGFSAALSRLGAIGAAAVAVVLLVSSSFALASLLEGQSATRQAALTATALAATQAPSQVPTGVAVGDLPVLSGTTTLSRTIDGYTVTIGPRPEFARSADANAIFLPYMVTNWQGHRYTESAARLVDPDGQGGPLMLADGNETLTWLGTTRYHPMVPGNRTVVSSDSALVFDAASLPPGQSEHTLELTITARISDIYAPAPGSNVVKPGNIPPGTPTTRQVVAGPFVFRFRLPFEPLHSADDVGQTVTAAGVPVTLQRVIAVPSEARVLLSFASADGKPMPGWQPADVLLSGQGIERSVVSPLGSALRSEPDGHGGQVNGWVDDRTWAGSAFDYASSNNFLDGGQWTLVIGALENHSAESWPQRIEGPWTFQFTMPPFTPPPAPTPLVTYAPGFPAPTQPSTAPQASHEPFPTVPLPGPVETEVAGTRAPAQPTVAPPPLPVETAQALETMKATYPTVMAGAAATRAAQPTPPGTSDTPLQLRNTQRLRLHPDLERADLNALNPPALSPQGDALIVSTRDHRLLLARLDGSPPLQLADEVTRYAWSSDGRYVVYLHMEPMGSPSYIQVPYSVTADGKTRRKLDFAREVYDMPDVTGDSTWEVRSMQKLGLWRVPLDGSPAEFVVSMPDALYSNVFKIAPDGKRMAYLCAGGVCLQNMDGANWRKLLTQPYRLTWSRDGSMLAVLTMHNVLLYSRDGTMKGSPSYDMVPLQGITGITQEELTLEWSAESRYLLIYLGMLARHGRQSLVEMDTATGYMWGGLAPEWAKSFNLTPDGRRLILRGEPAEFWIADLVPDRLPSPTP